MPHTASHRALPAGLGARRQHAQLLLGSATERGINIAMGTDTTPPDMLMNLLVGLITCRVIDGDTASACAAPISSMPRRSAAPMRWAAPISAGCSRARGQTSRCSTSIDHRHGTGDRSDHDAGCRRLGRGHRGGLRRRPPVDARRQGRRHRHGGGTQRRRKRSSTGSSRKYPERSWGHPPVSARSSPQLSDRRTRR